jgi:hypothetical protein
MKKERVYCNNPCCIQCAVYFGRPFDLYPELKEAPEIKIDTPKPDTI